MECFENYDLKIFNRWGNLVFESTDPNQLWDGQVEENSGTSDVYVYFLKYSLVGENSQQQAQGDVTLIR